MKLNAIDYEVMGGARLTELVSEEIQRLMDRSQVSKLSVQPYQALTIIGLLQLSMRHPETSDGVKAIAVDHIMELSKVFVNSPAVKELIQRGYMPEHDNSLDEVFVAGTEDEMHEVLVRQLARSQTQDEEESHGSEK